MDADRFDGATLNLVFGYASLIWQPGFAHLGMQKALLFGAHRRLCVYSHHYRGTRERPGLVFGLMSGGSCHGMAIRFDPADWGAVRSYLWERELISGVYRPVRRTVVLADGKREEALTFVADSHHAQYAGHLSLQTQPSLVRKARGSKGPNIDYVRNTARHLHQLGVPDRNLAQLSHLLDFDQSAPTKRS